MNKNIEKAFLDWRQGKTPRVQAKGVAAMIMLTQKNNLQNMASSRCVWASSVSKSSPRYLTRKIAW